MPRKRTTSNNFKAADTPLDARQRAIQEQEAKLRAQMEKYQKLIEEAPKLAKERERARRAFGKAPNELPSRYMAPSGKTKRSRASRSGSEASSCRA